MYLPGAEVLYCTVLCTCQVQRYCTVMFCVPAMSPGAILYCTVYLCCTELCTCQVMRYCTVMYCVSTRCPGTVLYCTVYLPGAKVLYCNTLCTCQVPRYCNVLHCTVYLPGAEGDPAVTDWQGQVRAQQAGLGDSCLLPAGFNMGQFYFRQKNLFEDIIISPDILLCPGFCDSSLEQAEVTWAWAGMSSLP